MNKPVGYFQFNIVKKLRRVLCCNIPMVMFQKLAIMEYIVLLVLSPLNILMFLIEAISFFQFTRSTMIAASRNILSVIEMQYYIRIVLDFIPEVVTRFGLTVVCILGMIGVDRKQGTYAGMLSFLLI